MKHKNPAIKAFKKVISPGIGYSPYLIKKNTMMNGNSIITATWKTYYNVQKKQSPILVQNYPQNA